MPRYLSILVFIGLAWGQESGSNKAIVLNDSLSMSYDVIDGILILKVAAINVKNDELKIGVESLKRNFLVVNEPSLVSTHISWMKGKMYNTRTLTIRLKPRNKNKIIIPFL